MHYTLGWAPQKDVEEQMVGLAKPTAWLMYSKDQLCMGSENCEKSETIRYQDTETSQGSHQRRYEAKDKQGK